MEVYRLARELTGEMTSSLDPEEEGFYDPEEDFLGRVTYTAANTYVDEDERTEERDLIIRVPDELGQWVLNTNLQHPEYFTNSVAFNRDVIKGLYVKPSSGNGTVLYAKTTSLNINFLMYVDSAGVYPIKRKEPGHTDEDSTALYSVGFNSTREVYQVNTFANALNDAVVGDTENTYLKSPAGIFTTVKLPIGEIAAAVTDTIIQTKLTLQAYNQDTGNEITMAKPEEVLLVLKGEVYSFFRDNSLPDGLTSYTAELDDATNTYTFGNISALVVNAIAKARAANGGIVPPDAVEKRLRAGDIGPQRTRARVCPPRQSRQPAGSLLHNHRGQGQVKRIGHGQQGKGFCQEGDARAPRAVARRGGILCLPRHLRQG